MVNWSPHHASSLSDIEIDTKVIDSPVALAVPGYDFRVQFGIMHKFAYKLVEPVGESLA